MSSTKSPDDLIASHLESKDALAQIPPAAWAAHAETILNNPGFVKDIEKLEIVLNAMPADFPPGNVLRQLVGAYRIWPTILAQMPTG